MKLNHHSIIELGFKYNSSSNNYTFGNCEIASQNIRKVSHYPRYRRYKIRTNYSWAFVGTTEEVDYFKKSLQLGACRIMIYSYTVGPYIIKAINGNCIVYDKTRVVLAIAQFISFSIGQLRYINQLVDPTVNLLYAIKK